VPASEAGEEMALPITCKIICSNILDVPFVNFAWCYVPCGDEIAQPPGHERVYFVVVRRFHDSRKQKPAQWRAGETVDRVGEQVRPSLKLLSLRKLKSSSAIGYSPKEYHGELKHLSSPITWHLITAGVHALHICVVVLVLDCPL
jgi:hypothetical protein